jgi:hypothetical protein
MEEGECILKKGLVNLYCDGEAFNGALYLTNERLVFIGYLLDVTCKYIEDIPLAHVSEITQEKSLFIIPNVLRVRTIKDRELKFIVSERNKWLTEINEQIKKN